MQLDTRKKFLEKAKKQVKKGFSRDILIIQAIREIDDIDKAKSMLYSRMLEWARINFPEISGGDDLIINLFAEFGCREDFEYNKLSEIVGEKEALRLFELKEKSFGKDFSIDDKKALQALASTIKQLTELRRKTETYVEEACKQDFPNLTALGDYMLTARLLALAGSLENMAEMPASTIQVIGAERALFKHLRQHTRPPKHGVIYQHPAVNSASDSHRGKIARSLAAKMAIAVKADYYTHRFIADKLKADFEKRLKQIRAIPERARKAYVPSDKPKHLQSYSERRRGPLEERKKRFDRRRK